MKNKLVQSYLMPLLVSLVLFVVLLAVSVERYTLGIVAVFLGSVIGTFILDLDYFIYAYFFEPEKEFSKNIKAYTKHYDILGALHYIQFHKNEIKDKTLNSVLFQVAIAATSLFIVGSQTNLFLKSLVLSIFVNSIYRMVEEFFENRLDMWFWALKNKPTRDSFYIYTCTLLVVLLYTISIF